MYWWITTITSSGKLVIMGPYNSEQEASEYGFSHFGASFDIEQLATRDLSKANRILKKKRFDQIGDLDIALERAKHQP